MLKLIINGLRRISRLKVTLQYNGDCGLDTRNVFENLAASNICILKTKCESYKIIILIEDYDKLNKLVFDLNKNTTYGVIVLKVKKIKGKN